MSVLYLKYGTFNYVFLCCKTKQLLNLREGTGGEIMQTDFQVLGL